jgi:flavin reductase (DIM6/NTAB) family NADH-FMN oxidoreductase RutF
MTSSSEQDATGVEEFRKAMKCRADTVHLVMYRMVEGTVDGMTATAVCALSLAPPSLLVCVNRAARAYASIVEHGSIGLSILSTEQLEVAVDRGRSGGSKAFGPELVSGDDPTLTPVFAGALATFQGRVVESRDLFTHTLFVVEVQRAAVGQPGQPLLHYQGSYITVGANPLR